MDLYRLIIQRYWEIANLRDWTSLTELLHPEIEYIVPQTREYVRGLANYVEFNRTWPGQWQANLCRICVDETCGVSVIDFVTDSNHETGLSFFTIENRQILRVVDYWPNVYEAPQRHCTKIERLNPDNPLLHPNALMKCMSQES